MKLRKLTIKNFRGYKNATFYINDLNVIIGKNDVGKSTIIDALDIFFNTTTVEYSDFNVFNKSSPIEISCAFEVDPNKEITLDSSENTATTLKQEYLLNNDNLFEVVKTIEAGKSKKNTKIRAKHPDNFDNPLITLKINELKKLAKF